MFLFQVAIRGGNSRVTAALVNFESELNRLHPVSGETPLIAAAAITEEVKKFRMEIVQSLHHGRAQLEMKSRRAFALIVTISVSWYCNRKHVNFGC